MDKDNAKRKLIIALQKERVSLDKKGVDTFDHEMSIHYLTTGDVNIKIDSLEILYSCVNDFECVFNDYCN